MEKQYKLVNGVQFELSEAELKEYYNRQPTESQLLEQAKKEKIAQCQAYLQDTDWYIIRMSDPSNASIAPENILINRANARVWQDDVQNCTTLEELNNININFN